jgi:hypothetical protein
LVRSDFQLTASHKSWLSSPGRRGIVVRGTARPSKTAIGGSEKREALFADQSAATRTGNHFRDLLISLGSAIGSTELGSAARY